MGNPFCISSDLLFNQICVKLCEQLVSVAGVNGECNGREQVETEDADDGFCIDYVASGGEIEISVKRGCDSNECLDIADCG